MTKMVPMLGFVSDEDVYLDSFVTSFDDYFNRLGGIPTWLENPVNVLCGCGSPMALLLQLYTPQDEPAHAYHRMVHVFCCKNGSCHLNGHLNAGFKVFRSQLCENNVIDQGGLPTSSNLCCVCGQLSKAHCSRCLVHYCSKEHQLYDWEHGHKEACSSSTSTIKETSSWNFPVHAIESEPEPAKDVQVIEMESVPQSLGDLTVKDDPTFDDEAEDSQVHVDGGFLKFEKRIARAPTQILRYNRLAENETQTNEDPLYISDAKDSLNIPECPNCHGPRTFEFQIMPQILNHMGLDHSKPDAIDFGTIHVYTCDANCDIQTVFEEAYWKQNPTTAGMQDMLKEE